MKKFGSLRMLLGQACMVFLPIASLADSEVYARPESLVLGSGMTGYFIGYEGGDNFLFSSDIDGDYATYRLNLWAARVDPEALLRITRGRLIHCGSIYFETDFTSVDCSIIRSLPLQLCEDIGWSAENCRNRAFDLKRELSFFNSIVTGCSDVDIENLDNSVPYAGQITTRSAACAVGR